MTRPFTLILAGTGAAVLAVAAIAAFAPNLLRTPVTMRVSDFGGYWVATRAHLAGQNPYSEANVFFDQRAIEPGLDRVFFAWGPPWTFPVFAPFAALDFPTARWVWRFVQIGLLLAAVTALWRAYGGAAGALIWAWIAAVGCYPTLQMMGLGQHSVLVLVGLVGWVVGLGRGRPFAAGLFLSLTLLKPQVLYLIGLLAVVWVLDRRAWRAAAGAAAGTAALTVLALLPNPDVFADYWRAFRTRPPSDALPPTLTVAVREALGGGYFGLSVLPVLLGVGWAAWYYRRHRHDWDWLRHAPLPILVGFVTSPYGFLYDQVVFLVPLVALLAPVSGRKGVLLRGVAAVFGLTAVCFALHSAGLREVTFAWHAPLCLGLYLASRSRVWDGAVSGSV